MIIGRTVDYIIGENNVDFGVIFKNAGILGGLIAAAILFQYLSSMCINFASFRTIRDLRTYAFDKLSDVPLGYIDSRSHGDLMSRVGSDIDQISDGLIQGFSQLFSGVVTIVGTLAFMLSVNYVFNKALQPHQQTRIKVSLGIEDDPLKGLPQYVRNAGEKARRALGARHRNAVQSARSQAVRL